MSYPNTSQKTQVRLVQPDYLYHFPCFKTVKLAAVKHGLFHPNLPTFRRMERDDVLCRLPDEHSRTTTSCTLRDFAEAQASALKPPIRRLRSLDISETGKGLHRVYYTVEEIQKQAQIWSRYMDNPAYWCDKPEEVLLFKGDFDHGNFHFDGASVRLMKPVNREWRYKFKCEPRIDPCRYEQQMPTPSDTVSRYRHAQPLYFRDQSSRMWRNPLYKPQHPDPPRPQNPEDK